MARSLHVLLFLIVCFLAPVHARAATISRFDDASRIVVADAKEARVVALPGTPVTLCGRRRFDEWSVALVGQIVSSSPEAGLMVSVDARDVALSRLLVQQGWLLPPVLDDDAQTAITERRGGWACASAQTPFDLMHRSVDPKVLAGIALNESGLNGRAWPWTLNVAGRSFFFRSREDAWRAIESLRAAGRCDFDVGLLQVNWCYHRQRFASTWDALAPATNIRVAESILNENYSRTHSVAAAIAWYHSANPVPGQAYLARFARHLKQIEAGL
ncbi:Transglycosylase SLT domain-containing protein [Burkholderia sp. OK233]|nr:Transglycosylase SLT domain-containing protein [Burkholderia sp. OK233]